MKVRKPYDLPPEQQRERDRAKRLEWTTIGYQVSVVVLLAFVLGQSQAMKVAWADDLLSLIPPIAFLLAIRIERRPPNERFPYGYFRSITIGFLCASLALFAVGVSLFVDSVAKLVTLEHPTIGIISIFGWQVWLGWVMIAALVYSIIPAFVLGRKKLPIAQRLHNKVLYADAAHTLQLPRQCAPPGYPTLLREIVALKDARPYGLATNSQTLNSSLFSLVSLLTVRTVKYN
jgi:divalent metal cation (Fe/Co/Zn/Cd) transporter